MILQKPHQTIFLKEKKGKIVFWTLNLSKNYNLIPKYHKYTFKFMILFTNIDYIIPETLYMRTK